MTKKNKQKRTFINAQHASGNVSDPTDNNLNIKRMPTHYEQTNPFILQKKR